ncbi:MAG: tRNA (guanine(46)-N(7))-methyltransferase TrmB [Burkholderiaceae bacterium]|nr:MAG: tRNA (guanine(46)-N(7))-methyltransferase TrmB [Burkholderiaceae bacterium]
MAACQNRGVSASQTPPNGSVPTFRRRGGRLGPELRTVLAEVLPRFELPDPAATGTRWDLDRIFGGRDVVVEVGSGMGEAALELALARPDEAVIAVDVHVRGIASLARAAARSDLDNLRVVLGDGLDVLREGVAPEALAGIRAWFPDPWPKARHHKRRLFSDPNVELMVSRLRPGGTLHAATDVAEYALVIRDVLDAQPALEPIVRGSPRPPWRPWTKYERAGLAAGRPASDFIYARRPDSTMATHPFRR